MGLASSTISNALGVSDQQLVFFTINYFGEEHIDATCVLDWIPFYVYRSMVAHNGAGYRSVVFLLMQSERGCVMTQHIL